MLSFRAHRVLTLLLVAVWQLFLPVLAYAHLSKTGALSQEVCTSWGMKTVVMAQSAEPQSERNALEHASPNDHPCCVFHLSAAPSHAPPSASLEFKPQCFGPSFSFVGLGSDFLSLHPPPTGPPPLI